MAKQEPARPAEGETARARRSPVPLTLPFSSTLSPESTRKAFNMQQSQLPVSSLPPSSPVSSAALPTCFVAKSGKNKAKERKDRRPLIHCTSFSKTSRPNQSGFNDGANDSPRTPTSAAQGRQSPSKFSCDTTPASSTSSATFASLDELCRFASEPMSQVPHPPSSHLSKGISGQTPAAESRDSGRLRSVSTMNDLSSLVRLADPRVLKIHKTALNMLNLCVESLQLYTKNPTRQSWEDAILCYRKATEKAPHVSLWGRLYWPVKSSIFMDTSVTSGEHVLPGWHSCAVLKWSTDARARRRYELVEDALRRAQKMACRQRAMLSSLREEMHVLSAFKVPKIIRKQKKTRATVASSQIVGQRHASESDVDATLRSVKSV